MDIKEFENKFKESVENYKVSTMSLEEEYTSYRNFINTLLTFYENEYKEGSLPPLSEIQKSLALAANSDDLLTALFNLIISLSALSAAGEPIKFSEAYTWQDDEIITKELLQKIEDKLGASLMKTDVLSYYLLEVFGKCFEIIQGNIIQPKTTDSIPPYINDVNSRGVGACHDLGQLRTYYSDGRDSCPRNEPYIFISNESAGIVEPRGLFDIYMLPTGSGAATDMSFSPKYYNELGAREILDSHYLNFDGSELFLEVLLRGVGEYKGFLKFYCDLTYSNETGIYSGSGEVLSTCNYTCSFDPKALTCKVSLSSWEYYSSGYEVFGADIMPKNKSYIPGSYNGFIPLGSNKKHFTSSGHLYSSELICENTYKVIE